MLLLFNFFQENKALVMLPTPEPKERYFSWRKTKSAMMIFLYYTYCLTSPQEKQFSYIGDTSLDISIMNILTINLK